MTGWVITNGHVIHHPLEPPHFLARMEHNSIGTNFELGHAAPIQLATHLGFVGTIEFLNMAERSFEE